MEYVNDLALIPEQSFKKTVRGKEKEKVRNTTRAGAKTLPRLALNGLEHKADEERV